MKFYPPYDFIIVGSCSLITGYIIKALISKVNPALSSRIGKIAPFALAYILVTISFAFIIDDLPLKFYSPDQAYDYEAQMKSNGPNIHAGIVGMLGYLLSVLFNWMLWGLALLILIKSYTSKPDHASIDAIHPNDSY